jgi:hypothetical protein
LLGLFRRGLGGFTGGQKVAWSASMMDSTSSFAMR